jgi:hypothetical protein
MVNKGEPKMKFLKPNNAKTDLREIQITINVAEHYLEIVEIYTESENGPGFIQVTSIKMIEPQVDYEQDNNTDVRRSLQ